MSHGMAAHQDCWIAANSESWLEVDLGADCAVSHISTMGRFPPLMEWPKECPAYTVVNEEHVGWENWTTRYEVSIRSEGGRSWTNIGVFRGNTDMTSEIVHDLSSVLQSRCVIRCRFLRFRPVSFRGKPALRVGVYGVRKQLQSRSETLEQLVTYKFPVLLPNRNMRKVQRDFRSSRKFSPDCYGKHGCDWPSQRRRAILRRSARWEETCVDNDASDHGESSDEPVARSLPLLHEWLPSLHTPCVVNTPSGMSWELISAEGSSIAGSEWEMC